jgi:hypothetical protein
MIFDPILDLFRGKAVTIPPLDGAFRPNTVLDEAEVVAELEAPDDMAPLDFDEVLISSGNSLWRMKVDEPATLCQTFATPITAIDTIGGDFVGLEDGTLLVNGVAVQKPDEIKCITALNASSIHGRLYLTNGSRYVSPSRWSRDLLSNGKSGSLWFMDMNSRDFHKIADGLAYPSGLHVTWGGAGRDKIVVSESWRRRLIHVDDKTGEQEVLTDNLPGYPSRMSSAVYGGVDLCIFAPMNRLIEFVLQEDDYRQAMMEEVPEEYWIAPALSSGRSFLEPLQCGGIRSMGVHKPWSPSRSYGLVALLGDDYQPHFSLHSRANGSRHGITSVIQLKNDGDIRYYAASKGGNCILSIDLNRGS